ncbi:MAG: response regulator, partial [Planctomycetes bacterium]|nr:response regulator [Planctomycetota bacterium]
MPNHDKPPPYTLIVADDDFDHADAASEMLKELGWEVKVAHSGQEAIALTQDLPYSVLLCDFNMPGMNGIEVLRGIDRTRTAFVMLTGLTDPHVVADALRHDCDDYAFKPVSDWSAMNTKLRSVASRLQSRIATQKEAHKLAQMADWQAWKAGFLKKDQEDDMQQLLRMLHVQFNQDANFTQLLDLIEEATRVDPSKSMRVKVPIDVLGLVVSALRPIAKFSDGIGIAASILGDAPRLKSVQLSDLLDTVTGKYFEQWTRFAKMRNHTFTTFVDPQLRYLGGYWLKIDKESVLKALNELVVNAFKHCDQHSSIGLTLTGDANRISVIVTNPPHSQPANVGNVEIVGLPREFEAQAFRLFYRLKDEAAITIYEEDWPMGLGLPLVRSVFYNADGEVGLHNETWHLSGSPDPVVLCTARASLPL